ncbi:MAG: hypothetical protein HY097_04310 [Nitrospinae bacterium]|nr:hypothetical protein [Nitrospinota bacterium]
MKTLIKSLTVAFIILIFSEMSHAIEILKQPPAEALKEMKQVAHEVLIQAVTPTPSKVISVLKYLEIVGKGIEKADPELTKALAARGGLRLGVTIGAGAMMDVGINSMVNNMKERGVFKSDGELGKIGIDEHISTLWMKLAKNAVIGATFGGPIVAVVGASFDALSIIHDSWEETVDALKLLPSDEELPPGVKVDKSLRLLQKLAKAYEWMKNNGTTKQTPSQQKVFEFSVQSGLQEFKKLFQPITAPFVQVVKPSSEQSLYTAQQQLTPTKVEFTQTYNGLFTQSANSPGSRYGTYSGTLTDGTRVNVIGDSRAGNFTGSFSGQTVAEPGYTPSTLNNSAFSGSSVGKVSAIGFKEGDLKGTMTVTVPAGTQTVNVTGDITIKTDGSLSMPSYSGPVTVKATGSQVGTMTGSWSQGPTR